MADVQRTRLEEFRHAYGTDPGWSYNGLRGGRKPEYSVNGLLAAIRQRRAELALDVLPFEERLREAELEAEGWLVEHGWPVGDDDDEGDFLLEQDWREGSW